MICLQFLELLHQLESSRKSMERVRKEEELDWSVINVLKSVRRKLWLKRINVTFKSKGIRKKDIGLLRLWILKSSDGLLGRKEIFVHFYQLCNMFFGLNVVGTLFP
nr:auxilin-like protein 1 isoform X3 [Ipomoea batatas]GMD64285.1 auxilin-like protein 1 isoform X3 [Ipomoea batatas]